MTTVRQTKTKLATEKALTSHDTPLTLSEIFRAVKKELPHTAFSTVYRIVQALEADQKVIRVDWRERGSCFEWAARPHHHHIVCEECHDVANIDDTLLCYNETNVSQQTGFKIKHHAIELVGVCPPCQQKGNPC